MVLQHTTENQAGDTQWTLLSALEHLDCADDIVLLSHTHTPHIQEKTNRLNLFGQQVGLAINYNKSRVVYVGNKVAETVKLKKQTLRFVATFSYPGSTIRFP